MDLYEDLIEISDSLYHKAVAKCQLEIEVAKRKFMLELVQWMNRTDNICRNDGSVELAITKERAIFRDWSANHLRETIIHQKEELRSRQEGIRIYIEETARM